MCHLSDSWKNDHDSVMEDSREPTFYQHLKKWIFKQDETHQTNHKKVQQYVANINDIAKLSLKSISIQLRLRGSEGSGSAITPEPGGSEYLCQISAL